MKRKIKANNTTLAAATLEPQDQSKPKAPTDRERESCQRFLDREKSRTPFPTFKVENKDRGLLIDGDHTDQTLSFGLLADVFCTGNIRFAEGLLLQIAKVARKGPSLKAGELNFMLATVHEIGPRDPTEALLATQMAAIHSATMVAAMRLNSVETIDQQDSASGMLNKLARTFAAQIEALKKYRSTGEQSIRVQHVTVSAGQAVVGINQGGGGSHEKASQSHAPSAASQSGPAVLGNQQAQPLPLQGSGSQGPTCVPYARRKVGSA